ncbi:HU family DNA-binding protein [Psychroflexus sp. ALD_RP9]|uniref:HU domain-containing protein n=1 Tax=Psychroflexus sp. ALD_RP9 TaxID=2777186 RepID=UPI001A8F2043|nr:HU family DNA-binding protein [Psychroflexus sp. ALD_RP9]QSS98199.1 SPOR domain-containing protein [Psychroflexus sp. ALD_RP9]
MSLITKHIIELLYHHDCVILPDFGAFLTQQKSAKINTESHILSPPKKTIQFSAQIKNHDGLLINSLAKALNISFQKAERQVKLYIEDLKSSLKQGETVKLKGIGSFKQNEAIVFTADETANFLLDAYGFQTCKTSTIGVPENKVTVEEPSTIIDISKEASQKPVYYTKYAAAIVLMIGIVSVLGYIFLKNTAKENSLANEKKAQKIIEEKIQTAQFSLQTSLEPIVIEKETNLVSASIEVKPFNIIAGAFKNKANADKRLEELIQKGYKASYVGLNAYNLHQVAYASFSDRKRARQFLKEIRLTENKAAWLLVK